MIIRKLFTYALYIFLTFLRPISTDRTLSSYTTCSSKLFSGPWYSVLFTLLFGPPDFDFVFCFWSIMLRILTQSKNHLYMYIYTKILLHSYWSRLSSVLRLISHKYDQFCRADLCMTIFVKRS